MKISKVVTLGAAVAGVSYLTYQKIADKAFHDVFDKREKEFEVDPKYLKWINDSNVTQVRITSFDGLKLSAYNIKNHENAPYLIMVHGICSNKTKLYDRAYEFDKLGYNLLLIDQRASGDSEGQYYTYGQKESLDLLLWIDYLIEKNKDARIALFGLSMGAATVMIATANKLPDNVKCIIEDCGYSSMKEIVEYAFKKDDKLKYTAIIMKLLEEKMKEKFNMTFDDACPKKCLDTNEIPIMFVHGMNDETVPYEMAKILYNHTKGIRKFYPVPNAKHTQAKTDPDYYRNIDLFIKEYI